MTAEPDAIRYRRFRAPREDGQALIDPPLSAALAQLRDSSLSHRSELDGLDCAGKSLADLAREARADLVRLASAYTAQYRNVDGDVDRVASATTSPRPIVMAGHQPTLFHPGVWFKNFALATLADQGPATAINLIVDNDILRAASVRVPTGMIDAPIFENVPFDEPAAEVPFEERTLRSGELFDSFADRLEATFQPLLARSAPATYTPLVRQLWQFAREVRRERNRSTSIGWLLAEARHRLEGQLGLNTLELPLSTVCDTDAFRWFTVYLLAELPRLAADYNGMLAEYRLVNHVRSRSHPVPDLAQADGWLEAPFWIWTTDNPRRQHVFARRTPGGIEITDRAGLVELLPLRGDGDATAAVEKLGELRARGIKIRPRALVTTMFSRLLASDLFLHGIGGAKYDELTDAIARRFFGLEPPPFLTVTATFQLPIARPTLSLDDLREHQRRLRETAYHPERFVARVHGTANAQFTELVAEKQHLLAELPELRAGGGSLKRWHQELSRVNETLADLLSQFRAELVDQQPHLADKSLAAQRLGSREFSFVLFPEEMLPKQLKKLAAVSN